MELMFGSENDLPNAHYSMLLGRPHIRAGKKIKTNAGDNHLRLTKIWFNRRWVKPYEELVSPSLRGWSCAVQRFQVVWRLCPIAW